MTAPAAESVTLFNLLVDCRANLIIEHGQTRIVLNPTAALELRQARVLHPSPRHLQGVGRAESGGSMSHPENARVTVAIAKNAGFRWCSACQMDKPAEGFKKRGCRWICAGCQAAAKRGART